MEKTSGNGGNGAREEMVDPGDTKLGPAAGETILP